MRWTFAAASDIGGRDEQQDRMAVLHGGDGGTHLLVIADGAGGHSNGALAAQTVVDTVKHQFARSLAVEPLGFVEHICLSAHEAVLNLASSNGLPPASTCVVLLLRDREAYWAHVGDSRLYHLRREQVLFETADHSLVRLCADAARRGDACGLNSPTPNQLYMCLGAGCEVLADTNASLVAPGDIFLLCSDGFWSQVSIDEVAGSLAYADLDDRLAGEWVRQAKRRGGVGADNISLLFARLLPDSRADKTGKTGSLWARVGKLIMGNE